MQPQPFAGVKVEYDVPAAMRDGTVLRANVYRPDDGGAGTYPVLLTRLPYGKDLPGASLVLDPSQAARRGYVVVIQDVRGAFTSEGEWMPLLHEGPDGADTVAWAAALPQANGAVGMFGASYFGYTQWAAAHQRPEALQAMAPMFTWADADEPGASNVTRYGVHELGLQAGWLLDWGLDPLARRYRGQPEALGRAAHALAREIDALPKGGYAELPLDPFGPLARVGLDAPMRISLRQRADEAMAAMTRIANAYALDVPVLHIGGWYDVFLAGTIANFTRMRAAGNTRQWLVIGPWTHGNVQRAQGDLDFGFASAGALIDLQIDLMSLQLQFFDMALKGAQNLFATQPPVKYFEMGANVWKTSATWPLAGATARAWYLHGRGRANGASGDGLLSAERPADEPADAYTYDPAHPVPAVGGPTLLPSVLRSGPRDQRTVEAREDVLVYTSAPLDRALEVTGPVRTVLYVMSDAPDTDFVARLVDVYPDGTTIPLADGITRMRYREGVEREAPPLQSGNVYRVEIDLWATSIAFQPGHRLRLDVTSSSFPRWERNLNTGGDNYATTVMRPARQTILHDAEHPSHVILPVVERADEN